VRRPVPFLSKYNGALAAGAQYAILIGAGFPGDKPLDDELQTHNVALWDAFQCITLQTAATRAKDIRAYVRAYRRGAAWLNANQGKDAFYALIAGFTGMQPDLIRKVVQLPAHSDIETNNLAQLTQLMTQTGMLTTNVNLREKIFS
jgi:ABC-type nitrate/sulfonate/bicarbonate transport system substrate-binding protein